MAIKEILTEPNKILRQVSKPVQKVTKEEQSLMDMEVKLHLIIFSTKKEMRKRKRQRKRKMTKRRRLKLKKKLRIEIFKRKQTEQMKSSEVASHTMSALTSAVCETSSINRSRATLKCSFSHATTTRVQEDKDLSCSKTIAENPRL